jgi:hypothetical protein
MPVRIGDDTDDYCSRCRLLTTHTVSAMVGDDIVSVTCRTCGDPHPYKGARVPQRRQPKTSAFDQVLAGILGEQNAPPPAPAAKKPRRRKQS